MICGRAIPPSSSAFSILILAIFLAAKSSCFSGFFVLVPFLPNRDCFQLFRRFYSLASFCTAAIIIDSHAPRTVAAKGKQNTLREYAAVDELHNDAAPDDVYNLLNSTKERHIIAALNFSVTDYHNISLRSTSASVILINSNIKRVQALQKWEVLYT
ncbi:hypothetical protein OROMI_000922 [Orobanche minor]